MTCSFWCLIQWNRNFLILIKIGDSTPRTRFEMFCLIFHLRKCAHALKIFLVGLFLMLNNIMQSKFQNSKILHFLGIKSESHQWSLGTFTPSLNCFCISGTRKTYRILLRNTLCRLNLYNFDRRSSIKIKALFLTPTSFVFKQNQLVWKVFSLSIQRFIYIFKTFWNVCIIYIL